MNPFACELILGCFALFNKIQSEHLASGNLFLYR